MWELYALWAFVPAVIAFYNKHKAVELNIPLWSFLIIASGSLGCVIGGILSQRVGSKKSGVVFSACLRNLLSVFATCFQFPTPTLSIVHVNLGHDDRFGFTAIFYTRCRFCSSGK